MTLEFDHKTKEKKEERKNITEVGLTLKRREKKKEKGKRTKIDKPREKKEVEK